MYGMNGPESSWWNGELESLGWQIANTKQETWMRPDSPFLNVSDKPLGPPRFLPPMLKKTVGWSIWLTGVVVLVIWYVTALPTTLIMFMSMKMVVGLWPTISIIDFYHVSIELISYHWVLASLAHYLSQKWPFVLEYWFGSSVSQRRLT